jgi:hypothetical protein
MSNRIAQKVETVLGAYTLIEDNGHATGEPEMIGLSPEGLTGIFSYAKRGEMIVALISETILFPGIPPVVEYKCALAAPCGHIDCLGAGSFQMNLN